MNFFIAAVGALLTYAQTASAIPTQVDPSLRTVEINNRMSSVERRVREAAVKIVSSSGGHGSGSIVQYKDLQLVLTAQHITRDLVGTRYRIIRNNEIRVATLIYSNEPHDIAVLLVEIPWDQGAIRWAPSEQVAQVGDAITYSGYPSFHSLMSFRGRVVGYEMASDGSLHIMLHTYGYFGCSGSVVYNEAAQIVGILWGIDTGRNSVPVEDMIWVSPIQNLNIELALRSACNALNNEPRACR